MVFCFCLVFCRVGSIHPAVIRSPQCGGQTSLERSAFSMPPHMNESFSKGATFTRRCHTQSYGRVFLLETRMQNISAQHIDSLRTNKRNFHHMFRITTRVSLARHTHDDHYFVRKGLFSKGEYPHANECRRGIRDASEMC